MAKRQREMMRIGRREIEVSSREKMYFPAAGFTKGHTLDYYRDIAPSIVPHLKDRPLTLKVFPHGPKGGHFYEKDAPKHTPEWVKTFSVERREPRPDDATIDWILVNDAATLVWAANLGSIEMHTMLSMAPLLTQPTSMVFDLDPGPPTSIIECCKVALSIRAIFEKLELEIYPKVSGSKGVQLFVPLNTGADYGTTQPLAKTIAEYLAQEQPQLVTAKMSKAARGGKVFIDWSQNDDFKSTASPYSLRAKSEHPYVSAPVTWAEIERGAKQGKAGNLYFSPADVLRRVERSGDLFEPVLKLKQRVPKELSLAAAGAAAKKPAPQRRKAAGSSGGNGAGRDMAAYRVKRDFSRTSEPPPKVEKKPAAELSFVIQKHRGSHLHYDFRLEMEGVLRSWAVPKGLSTVAGERRLAMHVEDHPLDYRDFEGTIPQGNYGAGTVMVWDRGTYRVQSGHPVRDYKMGKLHLSLSGEKLRGDWLLFRAGDEKRWFLIKTGTSSKPVSKKRDDQSVLSGRTLQQIAEANSAQWSSNRESSSKVRSTSRTRASANGSTGNGESVREHSAKETGRSAAKIKAPSKAAKGQKHQRKDTGEPQPGIGRLNDPELQRLPQAAPAFIEPMQPMDSAELPRGPAWSYELKFDGFRALLLKNNEQVQLFSRNGNDFSFKYPSITQEGMHLPAQHLLLDGEVVALDAQGRPSFQRLQNFTPRSDPAALRYYAFDLLNLERHDLRTLPLARRRSYLEKLLAGTAQGSIRLSEMLPGSAGRVIKTVSGLGLEGVVAKQMGSAYGGSRKAAVWVKYKLHAEQEFVIGGFTRGNPFDALLVGYYSDGALLFAGKVRAGFNKALREHTFERLHRSIAKTCPFANLPERGRGRWAEGLSDEDMKKCVWLKPVHIAQIAFVEWTDAGHLRHPKFIGLRDDKDPKGVRREALAAGMYSRLERGASRPSI